MTRGAAGNDAPPVIVVGAGIVGASLAYHLSARGQRVTLLDADTPGSGATGKSFGWIGRPPTPVSVAHALRAIAQAEYHRLEREVPGLAIQWTGSLTWDGFAEDPDPALAIPAAGVLEPQLRHPPARAFHSPGDGAMDPTLVTARLVAAAVRHGATFLPHTPVTGLVQDSGQVTGVATPAGDLAAATVILAAGTGAAALCPPLGATPGAAPVISSSPAVLVRLRAAPGLVRGIIGTGEFELRQLPDGTLWSPRDFAGERDAADLAETAGLAAAEVRTHFRGADEVEPLAAEIGWRPMVADGEPLIGPHPQVAGLGLAVMHQGVTLAAAVGRCYAEELITGIPAPEFAGCRPARFQRAVASGPAGPAGPAEPAEPPGCARG